jgi:hypothetical protein
MNHLELPQHHDKMRDLFENHGFNALPLLELVADLKPEYLESFCNKVIVTVAELLREGQKGGVLAGDIYEIIVQLHTLREAFRKARGAEAWP